MESKLIKVQTNRRNRFGSRVLIGNKLVQFNEVGIAEIVEEEVSFFLERDESLSLVKNKKGNKEDLENTDVEDSEDKKGNEENSKEEMSKSLALLKVPELRDFCESNNLPKEEWDKLTKIEMIKYIVNTTIKE